MDGKEFIIVFSSFILLLLSMFWVLEDWSFQLEADSVRNKQIHIEEDIVIHLDFALEHMSTIEIAYGKEEASTLLLLKQQLPATTSKDSADIAIFAKTNQSITTMLSKPANPNLSYDDEKTLAEIGYQNRTICKRISEYNEIVDSIKSSFSYACAGWDDSAVQSFP